MKAQVLEADDFMPSARSGFFTATRTPRRGTTEILHAYATMPFVRATVQKIAGNAARTPARLYARKRAGSGKAGERPQYVEDPQLRGLSHEFKQKELKALQVNRELVKVEHHPMLDLLRQPIPDDTRFKGRTLLFLTFAWLDLVGDAFWAFDTNGAGKPTAIYAIPPDWVREIPTKTRPFYTVRIENAEFQIPITNMLWFKDPSLANPYGRGVGVGHALSDELDVDENASKHLSSFFYNRAMPDMLVSVEGADEDILRATKAKFEQDHRGLLNAYRSAFVNGKVSVERLDTSFRDMDLVQLRKFSGREIVVQAFGLSPEMLGILDNSNRATVYEARAMFAENVLLPRLDLVESVLQDFALLFDERLIFCFDDPKPDDLKFVLEVTKSHPAAFTENEKRILAGQEPVDGGDVYKGENGIPHSRIDAGLQDDSASTAAVQDTALNGAQVDSLRQIIADVSAGLLPKKSARALILAAFPGVSAEEVDAMLAPIVEGSTPPPAPVPSAPAKPDEPGAEESKSALDAATSFVKTADDERRVDNVLEQLNPERLTVETHDLLAETMSEIGIDEATRLGAPSTFNMLNPLIADFLEAYGATKIKGLVNETTKEQLRATLLEGVRAGENVDALARRVRDTFDEADRTRAELIARTEVVGGSNRAIYAAHKMSGIVQRRQWVPTPDGRHRPSHAPGSLLAGQVISIDEEFISGSGAKAMHPGGFNEPSEDCNCRCTTIAVINDDVKGTRDLEIRQKDFEAQIAPHETQMARALRRGFRRQREDILDALHAQFPRKG